MPELPSQDEQLRRLREFLEQLEWVLFVVVNAPYGIIPGRHQEALWAAWPEAYPAFEQLRSKLSTPAVWTQLEEVGLAGQRLLFELQVFAHARSDLLDHAPGLFAKPYWAKPTAPPYYPPAPPGKRSKWWGWLRKLVRRCLKAGDVVLDSLAKVPGFGVAEGIKQLKDAAQEAAELSEAIALPP
jgi:hypothetical protein